MSKSSLRDQRDSGGSSSMMATVLKSPARRRWWRRRRSAVAVVVLGALAASALLTVGREWIGPVSWPMAERRLVSEVTAMGGTFLRAGSPPTIVQIWGRELLLRRPPGPGGRRRRIVAIRRLDGRSDRFPRHPQHGRDRRGARTSRRQAFPRLSQDRQRRGPSGGAAVRLGRASESGRRRRHATPRSPGSTSGVGPRGHLAHRRGPGTPEQAAEPGHPRTGADESHRDRVGRPREHPEAHPVVGRGQPVRRRRTRTSRGSPRSFST